ncbi:GNAT family N-acetyltransferase [Francisella tularensis subsp. novicida]|uniref:GNAT family N-acetyltransferase n=1 Tax=Francisella tularensis TaxID=263 RepID=UPI000502C3DF|nr:GNAT family N-acetyltransferase [Francisella tularensis]AJJ47106.1 dTDP-6-deoxy-3,4-keto-hexulose isomerase domain protein [Francisella tularensis subsp. novicida]KFJ66541.1 dTDP-6-deoxy-3,4-keto-hexulose isomerase domain protein [Francisella tularensis subsp. novicida]MBK2343864.1 GNAT family N-acetyltransferase [Francisella tularensis subsp. novicida]MBK2349151.1 GNAT family N-acetyltransferase [Francisella tularensis subsp. novicida]MBK2352711.1 GNAT family N-acetyltransferase [Francisel
MTELLNFKILGDQRGNLVSLEQNRNIPFDIKRVYYIYGTKENVRRGFHAHKELEQVLICVSGSCKVLMDNGKEKKDISIDQPSIGLLIPPMYWHEMYDFSPDCVLMVLASDFYDESDYIRDYNDFLKYSRLNFVDYNVDFLDKSYYWLNDIEIKRLTMTPDFTKEDQYRFFKSLDARDDYILKGIEYNSEKIGAFGFKNIQGHTAEYFGYIGEKSFWGVGLGKILIWKMLVFAKKLGFKNLYLKVCVNNKRAINLYLKYGFILNKEYTSDKVLHMEINL